MRKALAILFSLLLVWLQVVAATRPPALRAQNAICTYCDCGKADCCVTPASPDSQPGPATPASAGFQNQFSFLATTALAWASPGAEAQIFPPSVSASLTATDVPLYTRHCARLL